MANLGTLTIEQTAIHENTATNGGGLFNQGMATVTNTTISTNTATGIPGTGGGIANPVNADLSLVNCTLAQNESETSGGGLYSDIIVLYE